MATTSKDSQKYWWIKNQTIGIGWLNTANDSDGGSYYKLDAVTRIMTVKAHYKSKLTKIAALSTALTNKLPSQFDDTLVSKAISKGYELSSNPESLQLAIYWETKFEAQLKRIQEWGNTEISKAPKIIKSIYPYAVK
jgi:hypothetical protein|tara:strand:- start:150 stop:560 length:411 start_codon:yes stop_codon:yes gene_type:complete